ncbi:MAG: M48 family metallopeptidase [Planctomycetota bacterium]
MQIELGDIQVDVLRKPIKNLHLSVYPPNGRVRVAAPEHMQLETIRVFLISRIGWIKAEQRKFREQDRETTRVYVNRESHYLWGRRYLLKLQELDAAPRVERTHRHLILTVRPGTDTAKRAAIMDQWYRDQVKATTPPLIAKWAPRLQVAPARFYVQRMKTRWGSCNHAGRSIRLNTELAKKPEICLEYILFHELAHLIEPTHNARFVAIMDHHMPHWRHHRDELNRLPVRHEQWGY